MIHQGSLFGSSGGVLSCNIKFLYNQVWFVYHGLDERISLKLSCIDVISLKCTIW